MVTSLVVLAVFAANQKTSREPMEYTEQHKNEWIDLLAINNEVLPYLEQLYSTEDDLFINNRNGVLTISESASCMFSREELGKIEEFFQTFQWETIRLRNQTAVEHRVLEVISSQMKIGRHFKL